MDLRCFEGKPFVGILGPSLKTLRFCLFGEIDGEISYELQVAAKCGVPCNVVLQVCLNLVIYFPGSSSSANFDNSTELDVIHKDDLENHNKEGGLWVVIHGKVFDLQEFKDQVC